MSRLRRLLFALCMATVGVGLGGCGGSSSGLVPVDSPIIQFQPPETEDLVPEADTGDADGEDDWDELDLEDDTDAPAAPAPAAAPPAQ